jgi:SAM-dependent methyltransferase
MPILIPDTAPIDRTDLAFETQWELHARGAFEKDTIYGESAAAELTSFLTRFAIETPAALAGKRILDVGCGSGRLTRNLAVYAPAACIVGGDRSGVARFAHRQCRELRNALVVQFDLHAPPFGAETFDFIYADGVLPHVPDPAAALRRLDRLLRPGGRLFVWMYPRGFSPYRFVRDLLLRSCRYPPAVQQALCWMFGVPLHAAFKLYEPLRGPRRRSLREVVFMLHDNLTPEFQHRRTPGELAADFALLGYTTRALDPPVGIVGTKPGEHQAAPD